MSNHIIQPGKKINLSELSDCFQFQHKACLQTPNRGEVVAFFRPDDSMFGFRCKSCPKIWMIGKGAFPEAEWHLHDPQNKSANKIITVPGGFIN